MRKFRNKKVVTTGVAFLMVLVMATAFAAFQRHLDLEARVNMFAPSIDVLWAGAAVVSPPIWDAVFTTGLGVPNAGPRFTDRNWPDVDTTAQDLGQVLVRGGDYWASWHRLAHLGSTQHASPGQYPALAAINAMAVAEPESYTEMIVGMVFDNIDQTHTFTVSMGNPSPVPMTITGVTATPFPSGAIASVVTVDYSALMGSVVPAGGTVTAAITFSAPATAWEAFLGTPDGGTFMDTQFNDSVSAVFSLRATGTLS